MTIYYENHINEKFDMSGFPVVIEDITSLYEKKWSYDATVNKAKNRSELRKIYRTELSVKTRLSIFADSKEEYDECMESFERITERSIYDQTPGKLWVNDYYLECYIISETPKDYEELFYAIENDITILAPNPFWMSKEITEYGIVEVTSTNNKKYEGKYPYRYANGTRNQYVINKNSLESNFKLIIYGPAVNPTVIIGENNYLVNIVLEKDERVEIDSREESVMKIMRNGQQINAFHNRRKKGDFFKKIKPGRQEVVWPGTFRFDLLIYEERSVPRW